VFSYERVRASSKLTDGEIVEYLSYLRAKDVSEIVFPGPAPRVCLPTLMTTQSVRTAVVGRADALCTLNRDFYDPLVRDYRRERGGLIADDVELRGLRCSFAINSALVCLAIACVAPKGKNYECDET
jgi:hypothetical protein